MCAECDEARHIEVCARLDRIEAALTELTELAALARQLAGGAGGGPLARIAALRQLGKV